MVLNSKDYTGNFFNCIKKYFSGVLTDSSIWFDLTMYSYIIIF